MSTTSLSQDQRCNARQRSEEKKGREINSLNRLAEFSGAIGSIYRGHFIIFLLERGAIDICTRAEYKSIRPFRELDF